jgi:hypothetical protein
MFAKDKRMKVMNEMLLGMKSIKMYSWESIFERMIVDARKEEVYYIFCFISRGFLKYNFTLLSGFIRLN